MEVLCYNIHRGKDSSNKPTLKQMISYFKSLECDFICLQEVLYSQFLAMKKDLNMYGVFAANVVNKKYKYGICIFSKENIESSEHILLPSKKEQRGLLHIKVDTKDYKNINIINTHLGLDKEERIEQIDAILDYMHKLYGKNVLCGDFNEENISINSLIDAAVFLGKDSCPTFKNSRIDYFFCSKNCIPQNFFVDMINLSDHFPVISIIEI